MRFFFDYTKNDGSLLDYCVDVFRTPQSAIEFAHATVQHLRNSLTGDWLGWSVEVRDAEGVKFCSIPVDSALAA